jgi:adenylyltransferase/sulfurtransferase
VIHSTDRLGMPKVESARLALQALNPHVEIQAVPASLTRANVVESLAPFDVIVGCTDNFPARYLLNDACVLLRKPWVDGAIRHFDGQVAVYLPGRGPCYRCLFPEPPPPELLPSGADLGVMGVVPGIIGCLQASEVLKLLLGRGEPLAGRLLLFDGLRARFREIRVPREPNCPACGEGETP